MNTSSSINPSIIKFSGSSVKMILDDPGDHIQRQILRNNTFYEIDLLRELYHRALPGMRFIDIGANIGNHSLFLSGIAGLSGYAFEPFLDNYNRLVRNIEINNLSKKVMSVNAAVGSKKGFSNLVSDVGGNTGQAKFVSADSGVEMISLDDMDFERVDILKIDVEGYEIEVIKGAVKTISYHHPLLVCEASTLKDYECIVGALDPLGYVPTRRYCVTPTYIFERTKLRTH